MSVASGCESWSCKCVEAGVCDGAGMCFGKGVYDERECVRLCGECLGGSKLMLDICGGRKCDWQEYMLVVECVVFRDTIEIEE